MDQGKRPEDGQDQKFSTPTPGRRPYASFKDLRAFDVMREIQYDDLLVVRGATGKHGQYVPPEEGNREQGGRKQGGQGNRRRDNVKQTKNHETKTPQGIRKLPT